MRRPGDILIVSCYELGHQPLAVASVAAFLEREGFQPAVVDLAVEPLERLEALSTANVRLVAISVPMHTALHIGVRAAERVRSLAPQAHISFFGLYATLNAEHLLEAIADSVIGGEFEPPLAGLAAALANGDAPIEVDGVQVSDRAVRLHLARIRFAQPSRSSLPRLDRYATLETAAGSKQAAAVEASRGCLHLCRHCPIPPVYGGRFFVVPREVVLEDVRRLWREGAGHITFADPDFFNGPGHSMAIVRALHDELPELTFDVTTKVEHVLRHRDKLGELAACGCLFVVSAVESLSDRVLENLRKGHTRRDVDEALSLLRAADIAMRPSLVAFTPWTTLDDYLDVLEWVEREDLVHHLDPVQFSIRLLVPPGSLLCDLPAMRPHLRGLRPEAFAHIWEHPDPRMDRLHGDVSEIVRQAALTGENPETTFARIHDATLAAADRSLRIPLAAIAPPRPIAPRLSEPWFC